VCYDPGVLSCGRSCFCTYSESNGPKLDVDAVMSRVTDKSHVTIINSPNNPTGVVLSYDDSLKLSNLVTECDLIVISDEVHEKIVYDEAKHFCLATFLGLSERIIVVSKFSKTYAITGLRVGYALGPADLIDPMMEVH